MSRELSQLSYGPDSDSQKTDAVNYFKKNWVSRRFMELKENYKGLLKKAKSMKKPLSFSYGKFALLKTCRTFYVKIPL